MGLSTIRHGNVSITPIHKERSGIHTDLIADALQQKSGSANLQEKSVYENGKVDPDKGYDGLSSVNVYVPNGSNFAELVLSFECIHVHHYPDSDYNVRFFIMPPSSAFSHVYVQPNDNIWIFDPPLVLQHPELYSEFTTVFPYLFKGDTPLFGNWPYEWLSYSLDVYSEYYTYDEGYDDDGNVIVEREYKYWDSVTTPDYSSSYINDYGYFTLPYQNTTTYYDAYGNITEQKSYNAEWSCAFLDFDWDLGHAYLSTLNKDELYREVLAWREYSQI